MLNVGSEIIATPLEPMAALVEATAGIARSQGLGCVGEHGAALDSEAIHPL